MWAFLSFREGCVGVRTKSESTADDRVCVLVFIFFLSCDMLLVPCREHVNCTLRQCILL